MNAASMSASVIRMGRIVTTFPAIVSCESLSMIFTFLVTETMQLQNVDTLGDPAAVRHRYIHVLLNPTKGVLGFHRGMFRYTLFEWATSVREVERVLDAAKDSVTGFSGIPHWPTLLPEGSRGHRHPGSDAVGLTPKPRLHR